MIEGLYKLFTPKYFVEDLILPDDVHVEIRISNLYEYLPEEKVADWRRYFEEEAMRNRIRVASREGPVAGSG